MRDHILLADLAALVKTALQFFRIATYDLNSTQSRSPNVFQVEGIDSPSVRLKRT